MEKYVNKTAKQCKSKDENMKKKYVDKTDIIDLALQRLPQMLEDDPTRDETIFLLQRYEEKQS
jgi:hypothetical protein